jgi:L-aspartate semialdehyde sulfurtransferase ferredoxin
MKKRIVLHFPIPLVDKPIISRLVKDFGLELNILKAQVNPNKEGLLVLEVQGPDKEYKKALDYLKKTGVDVQPLSKDVIMDRDKCVDCTACIPLCPTSALEQDPKTLEVRFIKEKCIACGICIKACSYKAMSISF